jgi:hypothetical protein
VRQREPFQGVAGLLRRRAGGAQAHAHPAGVAGAPGAGWAAPSRLGSCWGPSTAREPWSLNSCQRVHRQAGAETAAGPPAGPGPRRRKPTRSARAHPACAGSRTTGQRPPRAGRTSPAGLAWPGRGRPMPAPAGPPRRARTRRIRAADPQTGARRWAAPAPAGRATGRPSRPMGQPPARRPVATTCLHPRAAATGPGPAARRHLAARRQQQRRRPPWRYRPAPRSPTQRCQPRPRRHRSWLVTRLMALDGVSLL